MRLGCIGVIPGPGCESDEIKVEEKIPSRIDWIKCLKSEAMVCRYIQTDLEYHCTCDPSLNVSIYNTEFYPY